MPEPQSSINVAGTAFWAVVIVTDGAGAVSLADATGVIAPVVFATDGTDGLIDITLNGGFGLRNFAVATGTGAGGAFFVNVAGQSATVMRATCGPAAPGAPVDLAAVATTIRILGMITP